MTTAGAELVEDRVQTLPQLRGRQPRGVDHAHEVDPTQLPLRSANSSWVVNSSTTRGGSPTDGLSEPTLDPRISCESTTRMNSLSHDSSATRRPRTFFNNRNSLRFTAFDVTRGARARGPSGARARW